MVVHGHQPRERPVHSRRTQVRHRASMRPRIVARSQNFSDRTSERWNVMNESDRTDMQVICLKGCPLYDSDMLLGPFQRAYQKDRTARQREKTLSEFLEVYPALGK